MDSTATCLLYALLVVLSCQAGSLKAESLPFNPCWVIDCAPGFLCRVVNGEGVCDPDDCQNNRCSNGGTCIDAINGFACQCSSQYTGRTCEMLAPVPGECPPLVPGTVGICVELCFGDDSCAGINKCCSNGCGHVCKGPVKPGHCYPPPPDTLGICVEKCSGDFDCPGEEKCCSNGCGHVCSDPLLPVCDAPICDNECPFGYEYGDFGCPTCTCRDPCKGVTCPGRQVCNTWTGAPLCECDLRICLVYCPFGYVTDEDGCATCQCNNNPCVVVKCAKGQVCEVHNGEAVCVDDCKCPEGSKPALDSDGKEITCGPEHDCQRCPRGTYCDLGADRKDGFCCDCPRVACEEKCDSGFQDDEFGCPTCQCVDVCENVECDFPLECVPVDVVCVTTPCPSPIGSCEDRRCPHGLPLTLPDGDEIFCGRGPSSRRCPPGSSCVTDPVDRFAVCCPDKEFQCPFGGDVARDESGTAIFCGFGPTRQQCPFAYFCAIGPADENPFCCPCLPILCEKPCPNGVKLDNNGCPTCECVDVCEDFECKPGFRCVPTDIVCITTPCDSPIPSCEPCPPRRCDKICPSGYKQDKDGCTICECVNVCEDFKCPYGQTCIEVTVLCVTSPCPFKPEPLCVDCPLVKCSDPCPHGFEVTDEGCQTCNCIDLCEDVDCPKGQLCIPDTIPCLIPPCPSRGICIDCPLVLCLFPCPQGYKLDKNGCQTCQCVDICEDEECPKGEVCVAEQVICKEPPCPWKPNCVSLCTLPADPGPCKAYMPHYYWDTTTASCQMFIYGGCFGNANRFSTLAECQRTCAPDCPNVYCRLYCPYGFAVDKRGCPLCKCLDVCENIDCKDGEVCIAEDVLCPTEPCPPNPVCVDICALPKEHGPCYAHQKRWFYNSNKGKCQRFFYGGCEGNANNFASKDDCEARCPLDICTLPKVVGPCEAAIPRYFYNSKINRCDKFSYGGCDGNANNFETLEQCRDTCGVVCPVIRCSEPCPFGFETDENGCQTCECVDQCGDMVCKDFEVCLPTGILCVTTPCPSHECVDICTLPMDVGPCDSVEPRYFYDTSVGSCQPFDWGGCGGNANKFESLQACHELCGPGCPAVLCVTPPDEEGPKPCPFGYKKDTRGCQTCDCKDDPCEDFPCKPGNICVSFQGIPECIGCPLPLCIPFCVNGYRLDKNGCQTCDCLGCDDLKCEPGEVCMELPPPCLPGLTCPPQAQCVNCPVYDCLYLCESGYKLDKDGCEGCTCVDPCEHFDCEFGYKCYEDEDGNPECHECPQVDCYGSCEFGFQLTEEGCQTCDCVEVKKCPCGEPLKDADGKDRKCSVHQPPPTSSRRRDSTRSRRDSTRSRRDSTRSRRNNRSRRTRFRRNTRNQDSRRNDVLYRTRRNSRRARIVIDEPKVVSRQRNSRRQESSRRRNRRSRKPVRECGDCPPGYFCNVDPKGRFSVCCPDH